MKVSLRKYCNTIIQEYESWKCQYELALEKFTNQLKSINGNLYSGYITYSLKYHAYLFSINAIYTSLFNSSWAHHTNYLIISKDNAGNLINHGFLNDVSNYPNADEIFIKCNNNIKEIYDLLEKFEILSFKIKPFIKINNIWLINNLSMSGYDFSISPDYLGLLKRIEFKNKNNWIPNFKGYDSKNSTILKVQLNQLFDTYMVDVSELEELFVEKEKKKSLIYRLFNKKKNN